ncbi:MAG: hypothetical protein SGJ24_08015 [Chloroflexota bacterium]|nr:hypothetical protein [Chloroflexota bacterium]
MKLQLFVIADYANIDNATGKMNIVGTFNAINTIAFPVRYHRLALALKFVADSPIEPTGTHKLEIILLDADGTELMQFTGPLTMMRDGRGRATEASIVVEVNGQEFRQPGIYEFAVSVDGARVADTPLELIQIVEQHEAGGDDQQR